MSWIDNDPSVLEAALRIVDEFSPVKEKLYTDVAYVIPEYDTRITLKWELSVRAHVCERTRSKESLEEAKKSARRLLRAEIYKDVRVELERLHHSLFNRDLGESLAHLAKLMEITRP